MKIGDVLFKVYRAGYILFAIAAASFLVYGMTGWAWAGKIMSIAGAATVSWAIAIMVLFFFVLGEKP